MPTMDNGCAYRYHTGTGTVANIPYVDKCKTPRRSKRSMMIDSFVFTATFNMREVSSYSSKT